MISKKTFLMIIGAVIGIVILLNIFSYFFYARFDFTADKSYTLSEPTKNILSGLKQPVTVTAYISTDLPPDITRTKDEFKDMLAEYGYLAGTNFIYKIEDPGDGIKAEEDGITPAILDVREKDQVKQQKIYLGAVIKYGTRKEIIPLIQPGSSMEYALTTSIKKMTAENKSSVGYILGHGEPSQQAVAQLMQSLRVTLDVIPVDLSDSLYIPEAIKTILIIAPSAEYPAEHLALLESFVAKGGNIVAAINTVDIDQQTGEAKKLETGLPDFFKDRGLNIKSDFVRDFSCASIMVRQQSAGLEFQTPVSFHYFPVITQFANIPPLKGIEGLTLMFPSSIDIIARPGIKFTPLAITSDRSGLDVLPLKIDLQKEWTGSDFQFSYLNTAVMAEGRFGNAVSKIVLISDGDFVINGEGQQAQSIQADNINFLANMIEYVTDNSGLAQLRNKGVTQRPIDPSIAEGSKAVIKYLNFLAPVLLTILFGFYRYSKRKTRKKLLSEESWIDEEKDGVS